MSRYVVLGVRLLLVLGFLIGMPILALPPVANWCETQLYAPTPQRRVIAARPLPGSADKPVAIGERTLLPWIEQTTYVELPSEPAPATEPPVAEPVDLNFLAAQVQALGATFYRLEQLPADGGLYRFTAEFQSDGPVPKRAHYTATAAEPAMAIESVIDQISAGR